MAVVAFVFLSALPSRAQTPLELTVPSGTTAAQVDIEVGSIVVAPGGTGEITVTLRSPKAQVVATLNDLATSGSGFAIPERMLVVTELAAAISAADDMIPVVDASALPGFGVIRIDDELIAYEGIADEILIVAERGESGTTPAAHAAGAVVELPGDAPDCASTEELAVLGKSALFSFLPDGCTPRANCIGVRAIVLALANFDTIPDGTPLYQCTIEGGPAEGTFPLVCPEGMDVKAPFQRAQSASVLPETRDLPTTCSDGTVIVSVSTPEATLTPTATPEGATPGATATVTPTFTATAPLATATFTATPTETPIPLQGDCDLDGCVTLDDVVLGVGVALGSSINDCPSLDHNDDRAVTIDELLASVGNAMGGCLGSAR